MQALSVRQPWAWLIVQGYKDVENRTWRTRFRGRFLVHAGWTFDEQGYRQVCAAHPEISLPEPEGFPRGGIVGEAELVDCVSASDSPWFTGPYGFVLREAHPVEFRPLRGKPGFFEVDLLDEGEA